jgi:hypothetical protein
LLFIIVVVVAVAVVAEVSQTETAVQLTTAAAVEDEVSGCATVYPCPGVATHCRARGRFLVVAVMAGAICVVQVLERYLK